MILLADTHVYTDGSCHGNGRSSNVGGYAALSIYNNACYYCGEKVENTTNNQMEMLGFLKGCYLGQRFLETPPKAERVYIYTDSAYIHNCYKQQWYKKWITNGWLTTKKEPVKNKELWKKIIPFFKDERFVICKVKGHADEELNNLADKIAVEYATTDNIIMADLIFDTVEGVQECIKL